MAGADDFHPIREDQEPDGSADEVVAVNEGIGEQLFPDDGRHLGLAERVHGLPILEGAGVADKEAHALLENVGKPPGEVATFEIGLVGNIYAGKGDGLDDEGRQPDFWMFRKEEGPGEVERAGLREVHVFQHFAEGDALLVQRLSDLLFEVLIEKGDTDIRDAQTRDEGLVGVEQAALLEDALDLLPGGGAAFVRPTFHPNGSAFVHVGLADACGDLDHQHITVWMGNNFSQGIHRRPEVLRSGVGEELIEPADIVG